MRFSDYFKLGLNQYQLDFVEIPLETDIKLYVDPYALSVAPDPWSERCNDLVVTYFQLILERIRTGRADDARRLLSRLSEPNETHLGLSRKRPSGRSVGETGATLIFDRLAASRAAKTGMLEDLSDCELLIPHIGRDKISDITTNIIKSELVAFTQRECSFYRVPTVSVPQVLWDPKTESWRGSYVSLPVVPDDKGRDTVVILIPKVAVRLSLAYNTEKYYRNYVLEFIEAEHLEAGSSLVQTLKSGVRKVYKKDLEDEHPLSADFIYEFSAAHPEVLDDYRAGVEDSGPVSSLNIELREPDPRMLDVRRISEDLANIPPGNAHASHYHRKIRGILNVLLYPRLANFVVEQEINEGRKRVDIVADNKAASGFFHELRTRHNIAAPYIFIECKNYSSDIGNAEVDQLIGRMSDRRGKFGLLLCRHIENRGLLLRRCKDAMTEQGCFILAFDDADVAELCEAAEAGAASVDAVLDEKMRALLF